MRGDDCGVIGFNFGMSLLGTISFTARTVGARAMEAAMIGRSIPLILPWLVMLVSGVAIAQDRQVDEITQQLFEQYVAQQGKINTESVMAATHLVAERGRESGFWKNVLAELRRNNHHSEIGCVRVLGKMLATDAAARDVIRRR